MVAITLSTLLKWSELMERLEREGKPMGAIDSLIAATAHEGQYVLATRNGEVLQKTGVTVVNPWAWIGDGGGHLACE